MNPVMYKKLKLGVRD